MITDFKGLYALDISSKISKKPTFRKDRDSGKMVKTDKTLDYLSWPDCLLLLYENGAEKVEYGNCLTKDGHSVFLTCGGNLPEVRVWVEIDGDRRELTYPVIDGSKDITMDKIVQSDAHNATQRAFVKCVAVNWGLGLSLWQKEEKERPTERPAEDLSIHNIYLIQRRVEEALTEKLKRGISMDDVLAGVGLSKRKFDTCMEYYNQLGELEKRLNAL